MFAKNFVCPESGQEWIDNGKQSTLYITVMLTCQTHNFFNWIWNNPRKFTNQMLQMIPENQKIKLRRNESGVAMLSLSKAEAVPSLERALIVKT